MYEYKGKNLIEGQATCGFITQRSHYCSNTQQPMDPPQESSHRPLRFVSPCASRILPEWFNDEDCQNEKTKLNSDWKKKGSDSDWYGQSKNIKKSSCAFPHCKFLRFFSSIPTMEHSQRPPAYLPVPVKITFRSLSSPWNKWNWHVVQTCSNCLAETLRWSTDVSCKSVAVQWNDLCSEEFLANC